jgi:hypothetical protein
MSHDFFIFTIMLKIELKVQAAFILVLVYFGDLSALAAQVTDCSAFHKGVFHVFQATSGNHYLIYRDDRTEREVVAGKGDSTIWNIQWLDAGKDYCLYIETIDGPAGILIEKDTMRLYETLTPVEK